MKENRIDYIFDVREADDIFNNTLDYYAATSINKAENKRSTSGGIFFELAKSVIKSGGVVFGCVLDKQFVCRHQVATTLDELIPMQGSKYIDSKLNNTYSQCLDYLNKSITVLFSGTPCQIANLYRYLKKYDCSNIENKLFTVDIFCHGVPRQKLASLYFKWLKEKYLKGSEICKYNFRTKTHGWGTEGYISISYNKNNSNHCVYKKSTKDPYYNSFIEGSTLMTKCYKCKYSCKNRVGDISIGDFWGIENHHQDFYNKHHHEGISAVMINTEKGKQLFNKVKDNLSIKKSCYSAMKQCSIDEDDDSVSKCLEKYKNKRDALRIALQNDDYNEIFNHILKVKPNYFGCFKSVIGKILPTSTKHNLKRILGR